MVRRECLSSFPRLFLLLFFASSLPSFFLSSSFLSYISCLFCFSISTVFSLSSFLSLSFFLSLSVSACHLSSFSPSFLSSKLSENIYWAPQLCQALSKQVRSVSLRPWGQLVPPPLQALGVKPAVSWEGEGGDVEARGERDNLSGKEVLQCHHPGPRRKGAERLLLSLPSSTPFI